MSEIISFNFALGIHYYTHPVVFVIICILITGILFYLNKKPIALIFLSSFILTASIVVVLKYFTAVPRPDNALIEAGTYAFPSNHATLSMFFVTAITWLLIKQTNLSKKAIGFVSILLFISSIIIGLSRLTLQVHTPIQITAGFIIGIVVPITFIFLAEKFNKAKLQSD